MLGITVEFRGSGINEIGYVTSCSNPDYLLETGKIVIAVDAKYFRPTEVDLLIGDPSKCQQKLNWHPRYNLQSLVEEMVNADVELFNKEKILKDSGYLIKNQYE